MAPRTYKKRAPAKYARKAPMKRARTSSYGQARAPSDGMNMLVSSYIEVAAAQGDQATAQGGVMAYSIKCDPAGMTLESVAAPSGSGALTIQQLGADNTAIPSGASIPFPRLGQFATLYRQYKVNSVSVKVTTDRQLGLDNPVTCLTDRAVSTPVSGVGVAMAQAHKSKCLTESDRSMLYGWKASTAQEKEYHTISDTISSDNANFIKVLQEIEPAANSVAKHRIAITCSVTLKDSKAGN